MDFLFSSFQLSIAFRMFDRDDSGAVDSHELDSFMEVLRGETNVGRTEGSAHKDGYSGRRDRRVLPVGVFFAGCDLWRKA